jgi:hypothetical protein
MYSVCLPGIAAPTAGGALPSLAEPSVTGNVLRTSSSTAGLLGARRAIGPARTRSSAPKYPEGNMGTSDEYRKSLLALAHWDDYLRSKSGLPGPRGNLELAQAVADEGNRDLFERYASLTPELAPENSPDVFLAFCGVVGLGRLAADGKSENIGRLRKLASDPRWRIREGVAMALQRIGDKNMDLLLMHMEKWVKGGALEQRAAAAAICEPRLLKNDNYSKRALTILNEITTRISRVKDRKNKEFIVLRKGMGYCWSVAVASYFIYGKKLMEHWTVSKDKDIRWIMRENLKKNRLIKCDAQWVKEMNRRLE